MKYLLVAAFAALLVGAAHAQTTTCKAAAAEKEARRCRPQELHDQM